MQNFDEMQSKIIQASYKAGIQEEHIKLYAQPQYHYLTMTEAYKGFLHKLTEEQVKFYLNLKKNDSLYIFQTYIRQAFERGVTIKQLTPYINRLNEFSSYQFKEIIKAIVNKLSPKQVEFIANPELLHYHMEQIRIAFEDGLSIKEVNSHLHLKSSIINIYSERLDLLSQRTDLKELVEYVNKNTTPSEKQEFEKSLYSLPLWKVKLVFNFNIPLPYNAKQIEQIRECLSDNVDAERVKRYMLNPSLFVKQLELIRVILTERPDNEILDLLTSNKYSYKQMYEIWAGYHYDNLTIDEIKTYACVKNNANKMTELRHELIQKKNPPSIFKPVYTINSDTFTPTP